MQGVALQMRVVQKTDKNRRAAGITKDRVQPAAHERWDPEEGFDEVAVGFPDVVVVLEAEVVLFAWAVAAAVVFALIGAEELTARLAKKMFKALSSCPRPVFPSYFFFVHCVPHVVPLSPPEHCLAAPSAEL